MLIFDVVRVYVLVAGSDYGDDDRHVSQLKSYEFVLVPDVWWTYTLLLSFIRFL